MSVNHNTARILPHLFFFLRILHDDVNNDNEDDVNNDNEDDVN